MPVELNPHIFRAYDIRGEAGVDLNQETCQLIARAYASLVGGQPAPTIVLGGDNRRSTPELKASVAKGLRQARCTVIDIGQSTSPLLYYCVAAWNADGGINVTGSHNPPHHNGLKLVGRQALPLSSQEIQDVYTIAMQLDVSDDTGTGTYLQQDPKEEYLNFVLRYLLQHNGLPSNGYTVAVDCGNAVTALVAPELLRRIGCVVHELHTELDSDFPNRGLDPTDPKNLGPLTHLVKQTGAALGVAFDGDGDRLGVVDSAGNPVPSEYIVMLLARDLLSRYPGATILYDVRCSAAVPIDIQKHGGQPYMYKSGHSLIKREMRDKGILFAGEGSGHMFFAEDYWGVESAILAAAKVITIVSQSKSDIASQFADVPVLASSPEFHVPVSDSDKFKIAGDMVKVFKSRYPVSEIDGARIEFPDGWALVRASNTNPELIVRAEASGEAILRGNLHVVLDVLNRNLPASAAREIERFIQDPDGQGGDGGRPDR